MGALLLVNILNLVDRQLPFILVESIRADLHLTDAQIGLMAGVAFAVVYSFAGLPLARMADKHSPRTVLSLSLVFWSLMTAAGGLAQSFLHLVLARAGVAAGEAGSTPAAHALIARVFPSKKRAMVLAVFSLGVPIGSTLGLVLGGIINDLANWRVAFFLVGLPGVLAAIFAWYILPEPPARTKEDHPPFWPMVGALFALPSFRHMAAGSALFAVGSYAMSVFAPAFLMRTHELSTVQAGFGIGIAFGVGGLLGTGLGGILADRLGSLDPAWRQRVPAIGMLLSAPVAWASFLAPNPYLSIFFLTLIFTLSLFYFAPTFSAVQMLVADNARATSAAVLLFCLTLAGSSIGPYMIGALSDYLAPTHGALSLRYALCVLPLTMLWSAFHFWRASKALGGDLQSTALAHAA